MQEKRCRLRNFLGGWLLSCLEKEVLRNLKSCVREWICAKDDVFWGGDVLVRLLRSGCMFGGFSSSLSDYNKVENGTRVERTERCVKHEQRAYANPKFVGGKKMRSSSVLVRGASEGKEEL